MSAVPATTPIDLSGDDAADLVSAVVLACPFVVALSGGRAGEVATYLPGRRVAGVRIAPGEVEVHVVARYGPTCAQIAEQVRTAVRSAAGPVTVTVGVDDLDLSGHVPVA